MNAQYVQSCSIYLYKVDFRATAFAPMAFEKIMLIFNEPLGPVLRRDLIHNRMIRIINATFIHIVEVFHFMILKYLSAGIL